MIQRNRRTKSFRELREKGSRFRDRSSIAVLPGESDGLTQHQFEIEKVLLFLEKVAAKNNGNVIANSSQVVMDALVELYASALGSRNGANTPNSVHVNEALVELLRWCDSNVCPSVKSSKKLEETMQELRSAVHELVKTVRENQLKSKGDYNDVIYKVPPSCSRPVRSMEIPVVPYSLSQSISEPCRFSDLSTATSSSENVTSHSDSLDLSLSLHSDGISSASSDLLSSEHIITMNEVAAQLQQLSEDIERMMGRPRRRVTLSQYDNVPEAPNHVNRQLSAPLHQISVNGPVGSAKVVEGNGTLKAPFLLSKQHNFVEQYMHVFGDYSSSKEILHSWFSEENPNGLPEPAPALPLKRREIEAQRTQAIKDRIINILELNDVTSYLLFDNGGGSSELRGGPVDALVVLACSADAKDRHFQEAFLMTYPTFIGSKELIRKLIARFKATQGAAAHNTFSLVAQVVSELSHVDEEISSELFDFVYFLCLSGELNHGRTLRQQILRKLCKEMKITPPLLIINNKAMKLLDFKSSDIAEQMTLLDSELFNRIELRELLVYAQGQSEEMSPFLTRFTEHFNKLSYWARSRILEQDSAKARERVIFKFVKIMRKLRTLNNFNSLLSLLSALDSGPIRRLEWPRAVTQSVRDFSLLIDSSSSFKVYREELKKAQPPCLPYIGLILQDLTFVHIGNSDRLPNSELINFWKRWQQFTILKHLHWFQQRPYSIQRKEKIMIYFNRFDDCFGEEALWQISEKIKPRNRTSKVSSSILNAK